MTTNVIFLICSFNIWINTLNDYLIKNDKEPLKGIKIDKNMKYITITHF